jgi:hypothetical protein
MELQFSGQTFEKKAQISNFMKILLVAAKMFHACGAVSDRMKVLSGPLSDNRQFCLKHHLSHLFLVSPCTIAYPIDVAENSRCFNIPKCRNECCGGVLFTYKAHVWLGNQFGYSTVF